MTKFCKMIKEKKKKKKGKLQVEHHAKAISNQDGSKQKNVINRTSNLHLQKINHLFQVSQ